MRALVYRGHKRIDLENVPDAEVPPPMRPRPHHQLRHLRLRPARLSRRRQRGAHRLHHGARGHRRGRRGRAGRAPHPSRRPRGRLRGGGLRPLRGLPEPHDGALPAHGRARAQPRPGRGHRRPRRRLLPPPHPRGRERRAGGAPDRHPPHGLQGRSWRRHPAGRDCRRRRRRARRPDGPRDYVPLRPLQGLRHRPGAPPPGGGRPPRRHPHRRQPGRPRRGRPRADRRQGLPARDRGGRAAGDGSESPSTCSPTAARSRRWAPRPTRR